MRPEDEELIRTVAGLAPDRVAARRAADGALAVDKELWGKLVELGLTAIAVPAEMGGAGAGFAEEVLVAETLARAVAPVPTIGAMLASHVLGAGSSEALPLVKELCRGEIIVAALPVTGHYPPDLRVAGDRISGSLTRLIDASAATKLLVPIDGQWWALLADHAGATRTIENTLDPTRPLTTFELVDVPGVAVSALPTQDVLQLAWTLLAAEAIGVSAVALELSREYASERRQFGQPIGRFQAIKHKLADMLIAIEGARSALYGAVTSQRDGVPPARAAQMAKAVATAAAPYILGEAVQIHGAIGNSWEHDLHLLMRRAKFCHLALGSADDHVALIAEDLLSQPVTRSRRGGLDSVLHLEPEDRDFLAELREWLDEHATRERLQEVRAGGIPARCSWQAEMAEGGWSGIHWPVQFGGRGANFIQQVLYHSEVAERGIPPLIGNRGLSQVGPTLIAHGTAEQKAHFLEATRRADILWASGFSEPGAGSDLAALRTRAVVDGDEVVVNGHKVWTTGAHFSDYLYTLVRTGPLVPKHAGISCVLIPIDAEGVTVRPIRRMNGLAEFNEVFLDDVRVPLDNVIGAIDQGWRVTKTTLAHEHMTNFLGSQLRQMYLVERLIRKLAQLEHDEKRINHAIRRRATQAWINSQLLRLHGLRNVTRVVQGQDPGAEGSIMKLAGQEEERRIYELLVDLEGANGLTDLRAGMNYLGARAATVGGGTSEIHRNKIAERVLGMPRDLWADEG